GIKLHKKLKQILKSQEGKILMIQQEEEIEFEQISIIGESENEL
ncbi:MAG: exodeoxyribonuclease VII small subunit, partial [Gallicola sp.]|nr:exodeoxyribonuclease VII small subunit [Gallicola sp.]